MKNRLFLIVALCALIGASLVYVTRKSSSAHQNGPLPTTATQEAPSTEAAAPMATMPDASLEAVVRQLRTVIAPELPAMAPALDALLASEREVRGEAVQTLGFADDARLLPPIIFLLLNDSEPAVRAAAAAALDIHDYSPQASLALVRALEDGDEEVRDSALLSLKAHRNDVVEKELRRVLADGRLAASTSTEVRLFLDRYYVRRDPLKNPLDP